MPLRALRTLPALLCLALAAQAWAGMTIRVLLARTPEATIVAEGAHTGAVDGGVPFRSPAGLSWPASAQDGRLLIDGHAVGVHLDLTGEGAPLAFDGHRFRGTLRLIAAGNVVEVVDVLDIEAYLRGVVPAEMAASWPMAALEAQAVAARSYALSSLRPSADYDVCATNECQVYRGMDVENPRSDQAVRATAGVVVTYDGRVARTYYHADSGGTTASSSEVWGTAVPYLVSRPDVVGPSPFDHWEVRLDPGLVARTLSASGDDVGTVRGLRVLALSGSGRVDRLQVLGTHADAVLDGVEINHLARAWGLKSTRFSVVSGLIVRGEGWGHGVGMSQYGARALADESYDYTQILAFYYPHTHLVRWVTTTAGR